MLIMLGKTMQKYLTPMIPIIIHLKSTDTLKNEINMHGGSELFIFMQ